MKKIIILVLSINKDILRSHFIGTIRDKINRDYSDECEIHAIVYTQGFDYDEEIPRCTFIRDDTYYNKGYAISEIRDYFTDKVISDVNPDYLFICDDDSKFQEGSMEYIVDDFNYLEDNPEIGISCMYYHKNKPNKEYRYTINPSKASIRSGMLIKSDAYYKWGGECHVPYFEEVVLAVRSYYNGYDTIHSVSNIIHKSKPQNLGLSLVTKYGKSKIPNNGREVMHKAGYLIPNYDTEGYPRYDVPLKISNELETNHINNRLERMYN